MNQEAEEEDFYHHDFTTPSDWEVFISRLEEVIREWKLPQVKRGPQLPKGKLSDGFWDKKSEKIPFADVDFNITRYNLKITPEEDVISPLEEESDEGRSQALEDIMCFDNDFPPQKVWDTGDGSPTLHPHPLAAWYGLRDFVILSPVRGVVICTESRVKILLSSIYIAINNSNCPVPVFVQIHDPVEHYYMGVCEGKGIRTEFEMVHLKRTLPYCKYLNGLLDVFKSKITRPLTLEPVTVSVQFTYILKDWTSFKWTQQPPDFDFLQGETLGVTELGKLPFGATFDLVSELHLFATWPKLVETAVVDSESYSDFEPSQAPEWSVRVKMADQPTCLLSEYLIEFVQLCGNVRSMQDLLGDLVDKKNYSSNLSSSLNPLTESRVPTLSRVIKRAKTRSKAVNRDGPISNEFLMPILYFLFPDAEDKSKSPYPEIFGNHSNGDNRPAEEQLTGLKTAPEDSLVWRLAVVMSHVICTLGGIKPAAHLWYEFCEEMHFRWENCILVPGLPSGFPDAHTCLLHQKLQMLNCCIEHRLTRVSMARAGSLEADESESDSEDEFFDCSADVPGELCDDGNRPRRRHKHSLWNQPTGRYAKHGNLRLLNTGEHLYIPITQDPTPKTEDQVKEDVEVMVQLGTSAQAAELRARLMSASLLSDMESFKAANPAAILEDFIRWYSPRDWIEEDGLDEFGQKKGALSPRMQLKDNMWMDVWEKAKPVPARRQKPLFDDECEAEKVLHFLKRRRLSQVARLLLPVLTHAAIRRLIEERREDLPGLADTLKHLTKRTEKLTHTLDPEPDPRRYEELAKELLGAEEVIAQVTSLEHKFCMLEGSKQSPDLHTFLSKLMQAPQVEVPGGPRGPVGSKIRAMFAEAQKEARMVSEREPIVQDVGEEPWSPIRTSNFPQPSKKEFIMRVMAARPAPYSAVCPQKLVVVLQKDNFRMAGSFSHDTTFQ